MILSLAAFVIAQYSVSTTIFTNDIDLASYYHVFQDVAEMPQTWFLIVLAPVTVFVSILTLKLYVPFLTCGIIAEAILQPAAADVSV